MSNSIVGGIAAALAIFGMAPYVSDVLRNRTHPHVITWLVWSVMTTIAFLAQIAGGGGPGGVGYRTHCMFDLRDLRACAPSGGGENHAA